MPIGYLFLFDKYTEILEPVNIVIGSATPVLLHTLYIGESKHLWTSHRAEHDPGCVSNKESAIKQHAETTDHDIHLRDAQILERGISNYGKRLFLELWHSTMDSDAINDRKVFPCAYMP